MSKGEDVMRCTAIWMVACLFYRAVKASTSIIMVNRPSGDEEQSDV
jgi:hypothetical protein